VSSNRRASVATDVLFRSVLTSVITEQWDECRDVSNENQRNQRKVVAANLDFDAAHVRKRCLLIYSNATRMRRRDISRWIFRGGFRRPVIWTASRLFLVGNGTNVDLDRECSGESGVSNWSVSVSGENHNLSRRNRKFEFQRCRDNGERWRHVFFFFVLFFFENTLKIRVILFA